MHVNQSDSLLTTSPTGKGYDLFLTVHKLDIDFDRYEGYQSIDKSIAAHPLLVDLVVAAVSKPNPWLRSIEGAQAIEIETGKNLTFQQTEIHVKSGQAVALKLNNPDVVPHNWVLVQPDQLKAVGDLANRLIANPEAYARHYVPDSPQVIVYTDIVQPGQSQTIQFNAPDKPGRYPYLCTFPGHWMVMNGVMIVE
jgi:azurin